MRDKYDLNSLLADAARDAQAAAARNRLASQDDISQLVRKRAPRIRKGSDERTERADSTAR